MKIPDKRELQKIELNNSAYNDFKEFTFTFTLRFRKNILKSFFK